MGKIIELPIVSDLISSLYHDETCFPFSGFIVYYMKDINTKRKIKVIKYLLQGKTSEAYKLRRKQLKECLDKDLSFQEYKRCRFYTLQGYYLILEKYASKLKEQGVEERTIHGIAQRGFDP